MGRWCEILDLFCIGLHIVNNISSNNKLAFVHSVSVGGPSAILGIKMGQVLLKFFYL